MKITIDGLDLAVSKERFTVKVMPIEQVMEYKLIICFLGLESCSTITSNGAISSESDKFLAAILKGSSEESIDARYDIMTTEVVELQVNFYKLQGVWLR